MMETLVFTTVDLIEIPVQLNGQEYVLREASGEAAIAWQNAVAQCTTFVDGKFAGVKAGVADAQILLVSKCLFKKTLQGEAVTYAPVAQATIRSWPNRIQKALYNKIREISLLTESESETEEEILKQIEVLQKKLEAVKGSNLKNS